MKPVGFASTTKPIFDGKVEHGPISHLPARKVKARDNYCCQKGCGEKAVAFWPCFDPDIRSFPYCRSHLDKAKLDLMIALSDLEQF